MDTSHASNKTKFKVGVFAVFGLILVTGISILVNNRPFWWRPCQLVTISVDDATGLKSKSPVRSLGIDIGYLKSVMLEETRVTLGICLTAPVQIMPETRAYLKAEGFFGDKVVELKPVRYLENGSTGTDQENSIDPAAKSLKESPLPSQRSMLRRGMDVWEWLIPSAEASVRTETRIQAASDSKSSVSSRPPGEKRGGQIQVGEGSEDVQHLVNRVDDLVQQMSGLTKNLKTAIDPDELKKTMKQLNHTLENVSKTVAPESGLNQTAQRTLAKLEDGIEQLRDLMTRVNKGEGSVGMLLNDPTYAQEIHQAIKNLNFILNKVNLIRFVPDLGSVYLGGVNGGRGWFHLAIWPRSTRYYLLGISSDSRGRITSTGVSTTVSGGAPVLVTNQLTEYYAIAFTAMMGKVFRERWDLSVGLLYGDGALSLKYNFGNANWLDQFQVGTDLYYRSGFNARVYASVQPFKSVYLRAGWEQVPLINTGSNSGALGTYFAGAGLTFDDEDIKFLFALK
jgi:phospholipid/cholesterol/gamma-HCH transport system substrate-binding protein